MSLPFGLLPHTHTGKSFGQVQPSHHLFICCLTMRSSSEWNVMTESLPPGFNSPNAARKTLFERVQLAVYRNAQR